MKILIVEDDRALNNGIALSLKGEEILQAFSLAQARSLLDGSIDLVILDINLPDGSGLDYCREIREKSGVAIIFLTANDMEIDIVTGLEMGADDYITKPFSLMVLRARVNAVFRRRQEQEYGQSKLAEKNEGQGRFFFDFEGMLFKVDGRPVELSKTEQKLLRLLVANQGRTLSREMLMERIWPDGAEFVEENALSVTMNRLRAKLPGIPVKTVYGIGYEYV
jgi:DNA-binding response OmpR family regulator